MVAADDVLHSAYDVFIPGITLATIALLTIVFNLLGCYIILKNAQFRSKPHFKLLLALSVSDVTLAVTCMPLAVVSVFLKSNVLWTSAPFCMFNGFMSCTLIGASTFSLTAISLDRFFAITSPLKYRDFITPKKVTLVIISIWVSSAIVCALPLFGWSSYSYNPGTHHCSPVWTSSCGYYTLVVVLGLVIPVLVMATSYIFIYRKLKASNAKVKCITVRTGPRRDLAEFSVTQDSLGTDNGRGGISDGQSLHVVIQPSGFSNAAGSGDTGGTVPERSNQPPGRVSLRAEKRVAITGAILIIVYFMCWGPYAVVNSCYVDGLEIHRYIRVTAMWIVYANSMLNPIIYTWTNKQVRQKMVDLLRKLFSCRRG